MFDFLFPVFNVLQLFQLYTPEFQLLLADHQVESAHVQGNDEGALTYFVKPDSPEKSLLSLISRHVALKPGDLQR